MSMNLPTTQKGWKGFLTFSVLGISFHFSLFFLLIFSRRRRGVNVIIFIAPYTSTKQFPKGDLATRKNVKLSAPPFPVLELITLPSIKLNQYTKLSVTIYWKYFQFPNNRRIDFKNVG